MSKDQFDKFSSDKDELNIILDLKLNINIF